MKQGIQRIVIGLPLLFVLLILAARGIAQNCTLNLSGVVFDEYTNAPLSYATVYLEESAIGTTTDSSGAFLIREICPGSAHLRITHLGCEPERLYLLLHADTSLVIGLKHHKEFLQEVTVTSGSPDQSGPELRNTLTSQMIDRNAGEPLARILETVTGVSALQTGSGIAKPIIHGLFGNRVAVLNNGLIQAGQQWGNDHAPEIDPLAAEQISVIKGVAAIEYGSTSLGGVILVEPGAPASDPHLHGSVNYAFQSNGLGHTLSARTEQATPLFSWRATGTLKAVGDLKAPHYFLTNTGVRESNFSIRLAREWTPSLSSNLYYSQFNTEIGILRGAHISNLTDLQSAIGREVPFFTEEAFSYSLNAPRQLVNHHLWKAQINWLLSNSRQISLSYGGQLNSRREFDVRRSGRTDIPALSLRLLSHQAQATYTFFGIRGIRIKTGIQLRSDGNRNDPETGILPLIPNYARYQGGLFVTWRQKTGPWTREWGARYDLTHFRVTAISRTLPRTIVRHRHTFHTGAVSTGVRYETQSGWVSKLNAGLAIRAPEVNELHSFGLHQGVAGIEEGDPNLKPETSTKGVWTNQLNFADNLLVELSIFAQYVRNFIFLEPQEAYRLTIRGAFPVFFYRQTNATLTGGDLTVKWEPTPNWEMTVRYSMVRGRDISRNLPLVFMPADNINFSLSRFLEETGPFHNTRIGITARYVSEQTRLESGQDFLPPPEAYFLPGMEVESHISIADVNLRFSAQFINILNVQYRDFLNRLRYYSDEPGRNIRLSFTLEF